MRLLPFALGSTTPTGSNLSRFVEGFLRDWPLRPMVGYETSEGWRPAVDILEKDGSWLLRCELPGVDPQDIELKLEGNLLTVRGERRPEHDLNTPSNHRIETWFGVFERSFTLPDTIDVSRVSAGYKNGILRIMLPQKPEIQPRAIPVAVH